MNSSSKNFAIDVQTMKRLETFVTNIEEKLVIIKGFYEKFTELMTLVSQTHGTIFQELTTIKVLLDQTQVEDTKKPSSPSPTPKIDEEPLTNFANQFQSKSVTNLNPMIYSREFSPVDQTSLYSSATVSQEFPSQNSLNNDVRPSSSVSKRSSSLKKSNSPSINRVKSPKSVSFNLDQEKNPLPLVNESLLQPSTTTTTNKETHVESTPLIISRATPDLLPDLFQQHHHEITTKPNIGYQMGNALSIVRIHEIEPNNGEFLRLLNVSNTVDYDLTGHFLQQNMACVPIVRYRFPLNTIIRAGQTITVWCGALKNIEAQPPDVLVWKDQKQWEIGPECVTILAKPSGQAIAWTRSTQRIPVDPPSSDIFSVHSKSHYASNDNVSNASNTANKSASRLSTSTFIGNAKGSPTILSPTTDHRSPMHQKVGLSQLLNRPKSSPYASHAGCKQDLICMNILRTKGTRTDQQTTVKI